tara:strand:- start:838 stop:1251 length:414 start_codon:yes stop_codon:yes gene_type:complete
MINTTTLKTTPYFNNNNNNYYNILVLNNIPEGPLKNYIKTINITNVSSKINRANLNYCSYAISKNILTNNVNNNNDKYMNICTIEDITNLYDFLINNNYTINNELTNLLNNSNNNYINMNSNNEKIIFYLSFQSITT